MQSPASQRGRASPESGSVRLTRVELDGAELCTEHRRIGSEARGCGVVHELEQIQKGTQLAQTLLQPGGQRREVLHPQPRVHELVGKHMCRVQRAETGAELDALHPPMPAVARLDRHALDAEVAHPHAERHAATAHAMPLKHSAHVCQQHLRLLVLQNGLRWGDAAGRRARRTPPAKVAALGPPPRGGDDADQAKAKQLPHGQAEPRLFCTARCEHRWRRSKHRAPCTKRRRRWRRRGPRRKARSIDRAQVPARV
mmetsp:Transcript_14439/g.47173  ORF Transcript_14439/g.47173 Transcript_14439/m.47173 type:complete len:255 (-) Transcript_14439:79-843(-)